MKTKKLVQTRSWIGWAVTQRSGGKHKAEKDKRTAQKLRKEIVEQFSAFDFNDRAWDEAKNTGY